MAFVAKRYADLLRRHPWKTQLTTSGALMTTSDLICQNVIEKEKPYDPVRTARYFILGTCWVGPIIRKWYIFLDKKFPGQTKMEACKKVAVDQLIFAPPYLHGVLAFLSALEGKNVNTIVTRLREEGYKIVKAAWCYWPVSQLLNFYFIPLQYRFLYSSVIAVCWNVYFSWRANSCDPEIMLFPE
ncbi:protein Mpv17-like [Varroa destructor]|uniref:Mitochondrial inner membrane protein Mpv17 n=1 Tax=Varroa destructor TaxID=109461 RepID=A0A7M7KM93_VARDE|nr:protein Mpv17-like [Varroa destructor]XP_022669003.1 protein Mpv17-like [Varroa destructor]XP_022669004.1 protein Mpv17-like [Varroa destructor]XP_022669005.1 protein Mpv17-like [Varroa destructor]XP_022669006.1 protein Mpv17-like [Varroa destructor]XP_022669007.1 protein Mpv17-like [Varroa destructor]